MSCEFCGHGDASLLTKRQQGADMPTCFRCGRMLIRLGVPARPYLRPGDLYGSPITSRRRRRHLFGEVRP
jgi:hypothetical protein